jgi:hypothetical protein
MLRETLNVGNVIIMGILQDYEIMYSVIDATTLVTNLMNAKEQMCGGGNQKIKGRNNVNQKHMLIVNI